MSRSQLVIGVVLITIGVLLLLDRAGLVTTWEVVTSWWPTVLILLGVAQAVTRPRNPVSGVIVGGIGAVLLLWTTGVVASLALLWPVVLIAIGLWLLARRPRAATVVGELDPDVVLVFADRTVQAPPGPFVGRSVTTVFGDVELDLRQAQIGDRARLQLVTVFGDVDVLVPEHWRVTVSGPELLGDITVPPARDLPADAPVLELSVVTVFGDIDVAVAALPVAPPA